MVWYGMVWYDMVWYGMVWYGMVWYGMVCILTLHYNVLHGVVLSIFVLRGMSSSINHCQLFLVPELSQTKVDLHVSRIKGSYVLYGVN